MSQEKVQAFLNALESNSTLGEEYKTLLASSKELSKEDILGKIVGFAQDKGHTFSAEDLKSFSKDKNANELSEEELDSVSGGLEFHAYFIK